MSGQHQSLVEKLGRDRVRENELLSNWTTFKIGGPADLFFEAKTGDEISRTVHVCRELQVPLFVLGGGSNVLVGDRGYRGLVVRIANDKLQVEKENLIAGAGTPLAKMVETAAAYGLAGLEFAVGIPGSLGGAIVGNAGAWRQAIGDKIVRVKILALEDSKEAWLERAACQFSYRQSRFKKTKEIVIEAEVGLQKGEKQKIRSLMAGYLEKRSDQPKEPSVGCIFVNPKLAAAGALIDQCGLKGQRSGGAQISTNHANFIVNLGQATAQDVVELISLAKEKVRERFKVNLVEEIKRVGDF